MSTLRLMAIDAICQRGSVRDSDVATLRRAFALDPQIAATDIDGLFRAHNLARVQDPSWTEFFIETLTDYVVRELEPAGYVTAAHAGWLIARVSNAGRVRTKTELDLLLNVIDKARWVPESLLVFALGQLRDAVTTGDGPLRTCGEYGPGMITLAEVEQIRALLFAYGDEGPASITHVEIQMLLDIEQSIARRLAHTVPDDHASPLEAWPIESWRDLLEKAITSAVLAASGYAGPTREEALNEARPLTGLGSHSGLTSQHLRDGRLTLIAGAQGGLIFAYKPLPTEARAMARLELQRIEIITGEPVTPTDPIKLCALLLAPELQAGPAPRILDLLRASGFALHPAFITQIQRGAVYAA